MKKATVPLSLVLVWLGTNAPSLFGAKVVERIIARVNNEIVTQRMFEREKEKLRQQLAQDYSGPELEVQFRNQSKNLLRDLIDQSLMVQKAKDLDINVETDLVKRLDGIRKQNNLETIEDLQKEVEKQGLIWEDFKDQIRRNMLMQQVIEREVGRTIVVSREDAKKYYDAHKNEFQSPGGIHLAQILVSSEKRKPEEAEKRAKEALAELKAGQKWVDVVKKYSDDASANEGGDVGFFKNGTLAPALAKVVDKLEVGDNSDIIQTKYGYSIIKLLEKYNPGIPPFDQIEQRIEEMLYNQQMQPALRKYLVNLRKESYIFLAPGFLDTGAERPSDALVATKGQ
jgi:peptidyl-prolyl cis-trans isomerase SurA